VRLLNTSTLFSADGNDDFQVLWEDGDRIFCRSFRHGNEHNPVLAVLAAAEYPTPATFDRLTQEYGLKEDLDGAWAVRPLELTREGGQTVLLLRQYPLKQSYSVTTIFHLMGAGSIWASGHLCFYSAADSDRR
jgi:hypothetical protein